MTPDQFRLIIREELEPVKLDLGKIKQALFILADALPGTMPGHKSHTRLKLEEVLK